MRNPTLSHIMPLNGAMPRQQVSACRGIELPLLGSNQDSPDPEEGERGEMPRPSGFYRPLPAYWRPQATDSTPIAPRQHGHSAHVSHHLTDAQMWHVKKAEPASSGEPQEVMG